MRQLSIQVKMYKKGHGTQCKILFVTSWAIRMINIFAQLKIWSYWAIVKFSPCVWNWGNSDIFVEIWGFGIIHVSKCSSHFDKCMYILWFILSLILVLFSFSRKGSSISVAVCGVIELFYRQMQGFKNKN